MDAGSPCPEDGDFFLLWQFGRGKPRPGGLSVEKTGAKKAVAQKERLLRGAETRRRRKADRE